MRFSAFPVLLRYFNSQPHKEADWKRFYICKTLFHFNSQPHKEADEKDPD